MRRRLASIGRSASGGAAPGEAFTRRFFYDNPDIKDFEPVAVMDGVEVGFGMPIADG